MDINATAVLEPEAETSDEGLPTLVVRPCEPSELVAIRREFPALPAEPAGTTLVAWFDGKPIGHVQIRWRGSVHSFVRARLPKTPEIRRLRVHPDAQGRGAAKALLREAEELAVALGYRSVGLAVGVTNETAIRLYRRCGYASSSISDFNSSMGMDEQGNRYTHTVQYMVKPVGRSAQALVVA
jgi:ribosomal protein S18 acetylase RimI-like enzyme